jgi:Fe-S oxidoreductase
MGRAVEMCSGLGVCRKTIDGTMCPSYMATREEKHSTRGRANTLRLAMAGRLGETALGDQDVHDVLDLCLACRAGTAECPVGVDVGRYVPGGRGVRARVVVWSAACGPAVS